MIYLNENGGRQEIWIPSKGKANGYNGATAPLYQEITENGEYVWERSNGYSPVTVSVDVPQTGKVDVAATGTRLSYSTFTTVPDIYDFSNCTDMNFMFCSCQLLVTIPQIVTSKVTRMFYMFYCDYALETIPPLDTRNVWEMTYMFIYCNKLTTVQQLDTSKVTNMSGMFSHCTSLTSLNLVGSLNTSLELNDSPLNEESIKSVLTAASKTTNTDAKTLTFKEGSTLKDTDGVWAALVAECTTKGWTIQNLTLA